MVILAMVAVVWAGLAPAADGADPVFDRPTPEQFAAVGATAKSITFRTLPSRWLVDDWHRLGVKVRVQVVPEADESPARFRRRAGFLAFRSGADEICWGGDETDRDFFSPALAAAADDRALVGKLDALAERAMADKNSDTRLAGRRERVYVQLAADFSLAPSALIRRELALRIRKLQKLLGEEPIAVPKDIPDAPAKPFVAPKKAREVEPAPEFHGVKLFPDLELRIHSYGLEFLVLGDRKIQKDEWPGVKRAYTLYIPSTNRAEWLTYKLSCDLTDRKTNAGDAAPRLPFYTLEPRFFGTVEKRFQTRAMHLPGYGRPELRLPYGYESPVYCNAGKDENWAFPFSYTWDQFDGILPKRNTVWYVRADEGWVRITWRNPVDGFSGLCFSNVFRQYNEATSAALGDWGYEDALFRDACVQPLIDRNANLVTMISRKLDGYGKARWSAADKFIREKAAANFGGVTLFVRDLEAARMRYLDEVFAGREIKVPERKKKDAEKPTKGPSLDDDEDGMNLDDTEH